MKIVFFSESGYQGKVSVNEPDMRTDLAWMYALNAYHCNIHTTPPETYDLGIVIIPKNNPQFNINNLKKYCDKIAVMQEGPHWYFQDYTLDQQIWYYNTLIESDIIFTHNQQDKLYYKGLTGHDDIRILPTLMIQGALDSLNLPNVKREAAMIGGNFCNWYGGFDSYMVAQEFKQHIYIPSMGRRVPGEEQLPNLKHLPYMSWRQWIEHLNTMKYAVHLMRTHAAGTFALNCAYLGVPCIGYKGLDTQELCHPETTVEVGDLVTAKEIAKKLREDEKFYIYCNKIAKAKYKELYHEDKFNNTFKEQFKIS